MGYSHILCVAYIMYKQSIELELSEYEAFLEKPSSRYDLTNKSGNPNNVKVFEIK